MAKIVEKIFDLYISYTLVRREVTAIYRQQVLETWHVAMYRYAGIGHVADPYCYQCRMCEPILHKIILRKLTVKIML